MSRIDPSGQQTHVDSGNYSRRGTHHPRVIMRRSVVLLAAIVAALWLIAAVWPNRPNR